MNGTQERYLRDILIFVASIGVAIVLARSGVLIRLIAISAGIPYLASFVAGMFFTSFLTVAPATAAIIALAEQGTPLERLAFVGGLGAMTSDFIIFLLFREAVAEPILSLARAGDGSRIARFIRKGRHRLIGTLLGAVIIASPFPDELGLLLMGLARARWYTTLAVTYALNAAGIAAVALAVRALS